MARENFEIIVINKGRVEDYYDFWDRNVVKNAKGEVLHPALLGFAVYIEAESPKEAASLAKKQFPDLTVDFKSVKRTP